MRLDKLQAMTYHPLVTGEFYETSYAEDSEAAMSRGTTYLSLLAALRQEELLEEARRRRRSTDVIRRRRGQTLDSRIGRILRPKR
jgi:hypothetical protein